MKKVLLLGPNTSNSERYEGGIQNVIEPLKGVTQLFMEAGIDLSFFNTERISRSRATAGRFSLENFINARKIYRDCAKELETQRYDTLLFASSVGLALLKDLLIANKLKKKYGVKVVFQIHFADMDVIMPIRYGLGKMIFRQLIAVCDGCIFLSQKLMDEFVEKGFPQDRSFLLYNYQNIKLNGENVASKPSHTNAYTPIGLIFMGSYDRRKGLLDLLNTLDNIDDRLYTLDLCGGYNNNDWELQSALESFCLRHSTSCVNNGYVRGENKGNLLLKADVCVLPSYSEGLPVVLLEAMATGCAIITTNVGANAEIIKSGKNGIVIEAGDIVSLKAAIVYLINNRIQLHLMQNRNFAEAKIYTLGNYTRTLCKILS